MGQGNSGVIGQSSTSVNAQRYRIMVAFVLTAVFVAIKAVGHDYWSVGFGLALLGVILLTPQPADRPEPWRAHALRVVSACFVVVTLASIWTTLATVL
jgi:apolipoprotein N-acyltransferase